MKNYADVVHECLSVGQREPEARNRAVSRYGDNFMAKFRHGFAEFIKELKKHTVMQVMDIEIQNFPTHS